MSLIWLADDRSPIGSDTSRAIDAVDARGGVGLLSESERTKRNYYGERHVFHFKYTVRQLEQPAPILDTGANPRTIVQRIRRR